MSDAQLRPLERETTLPGVLVVERWRAPDGTSSWICMVTVLLDGFSLATERAGGSVVSGLRWDQDRQHVSLLVDSVHLSFKTDLVAWCPRRNGRPL